MLLVFGLMLLPPAVHRLSGDCSVPASFEVVMASISMALCRSMLLVLRVLQVTLTWPAVLYDYDCNTYGATWILQVTASLL